MDPTTYFIDDGRLFDAEELQSLGSEMDELVDHIRDSTYGEELSLALDELEDADSLIQFEHALDAALLEYTDHLSNRYPVSITAVMSYILAKEREVENIRAIARGREAGLDEDEIERELVIL
jgi:V/A-type H+-transporting ATPase subunit C